MISVLAIDPATLTGWACWQTGKPKPRAGTWELAKIDVDDKKGALMGKWIDQFINRASDFCQVNQVTDIVVESPYVPVYNGGVNIDSVAVNVTLVKICHLVAYRAGARIHEAMRPHVLYHFIRQKGGERKFLKQSVLLRCQQRGWNVTDDNMGDALATLDYWLYKNDAEAVPWDCSPIAGPLFSGAEVKPKDAAGVAKLANAAMRMER